MNIFSIRERLTARNVFIFGPTIVALIVAGFFYVKWQQTSRLVDEQLAGSGQQTEAVRQEIEQLVAEVSEVVALPSDEVPTVTTVTDVDEIRENRDFFAEAENGDKVLVYQAAKKVYLYRPETKKLINLAPLTIAGEQVDAETQTPVPSEPLSVVLFNGTTTPGATTAFEPTVTSADPAVRISGRVQAAATYDESRLVVLNTERAPQAAALAESLSIPLAELPAGETAPAADVLIIVGKDHL